MPKIFNKNYLQNIKERSPVIAVLLTFTFLYFWSNLYISVFSIPLLLFFALGVSHRHELCIDAREYRLEICLFLLLLLLGVALSSLPQKSAKGAYDFMRGGIMFFSALLVARKYRDRFDQLFLPFLAGTTLVFAACAMFSYWQNPDGLYSWRGGMMDIFGHYNNFGTCTASCAVMALAYILFSSYGRRQLILAVAVFSVSSFLALLSGSRGSVVSLVVTALFALLIYCKKYRFVTSVALAILFGLFVVAVQYELFSSLVATWSRGGNFSGGRFLIYTTILMETFDKAPFFGFGINTYKYLGVAQPFADTWVMPHNVYLEAFYSLGLVGCLILALLCFRLLRRLLGPLPPARFLYCSGVLLLVFYLSRGLVDFKLWSVTFPAVLALGLGWAIGAKSSVPPEDEPVANGSGI